ncbi:alanyl-tRNA editing protein [Egicoccus sp. AB-alg6-2]|uniref:alanyl-tRNA editing protein n=1 Tax=Egicoccus sp. AB-alg6-2 TaxID=3242692 RepID=UPI00359DC120
MTERIYSTRQYERETTATVVDVDRDDGRVLLDRTVFYPGGGGQPHDVGDLWIGDDRLRVVRVGDDGRGVWHWLDPGDGLPGAGQQLSARVDWDRRYRLMRTHTAMHALCGVVWSRFASPVTGGNMEPGEGRLDFELPAWDPEDRDPLEDELNRQLLAARPVEVSFLPRDDADRDPSLIRTKVSLLPSSLRQVRVVDIVGLDRQADGGTHVADTTEVGRIRIVKVESKGKGFRRIRLRLDDA